MSDKQVAKMSMDELRREVLELREDIQESNNFNRLKIVENANLIDKLVAARAALKYIYATAPGNGEDASYAIAKQALENQ
jgi:hypothetical protein